MKRLILSTAIVLGGLTAVTAQSDKEPTALNKASQTAVEQKVENRLIAAQDAETSNLAEAVQDYKEVKISEVPQTVKDAIAKEFNGATISKAYVNAQGDYKIQLATAVAGETTVMVNQQGELIKKELKKQ
ncbi:hypothetical protein EI546_09125 [Aequorivita sp. H23M31]|uniref:Uncharacterized protein n=1 Tax=Aequorivita ciconiae TaxID=2494375 RepID=A0A410G3L7_9FLAO|nr:hypothetical protein [Aequorivita sp. H23M31]QAA81872.1 hypothetical protein EI546_09125 [Aequorivita sp. H23M31]